jgi:hypothetical protein
MVEFTNVSATATQIYVVPPYGKSSISVFNNSNAPVYLGGSAVTAASGAALPPGTQLQLTNTTSGLWAISGPGVLGTASTLSANVAVGATTASITATSGFGTSTTLLIGANAGSSDGETVTIATLTGTSATFTSATRFAHLSGEAISLVSAPQVSSVIVHRGTA